MAKTKFNYFGLNKHEMYRKLYKKISYKYQTSCFFLILIAWSVSQFIQARYAFLNCLQEFLFTCSLQFVQARPVSLLLIII